MNAKQDLKSRRDSFDDVSEADVKRFQQHQESYTKSQEKASKLMKQSSDTSSAITGNLK